MKKITNIDFETTCKNTKTALDRFFKKYPEHEEAWREEMEYMLESGNEFESDEKLADGTKQPFTWALHAQHEENWFYFAIIERS